MDEEVEEEEKKRENWDGKRKLNREGEVWNWK